MSVTAASTAGLLPWTTDNASERVPVKTLSQQDFLKLLVAQITSQNPLQPNADLGSIAQMAQFTALEQARQMQTDLQQLRDQQQWLQAAALLGRPVAIASRDTERIEGVVQAIQLEEGEPRLLVDDQLYRLDQVVAILTAPTS